MMMAHLMTVCPVDVTSDKKALFSWVGSLHVKFVIGWKCIGIASYSFQ